MKEFCKKWFSKEGLLKIFHSFVWVAVLVFATDIVTKWVVQNNLVYDHTSITLIENFLYITLTHNTGASFGIGSSGELGWRIFWIFVSFALTGAIIFVLIRYFKKFTYTQRISLALMIGGAFGNLIDRTFYWDSTVGFNGVIDWIDFVFGPIDFAIFNIADACLVIGVFMLVLVELVNLIKEVREKDKRGEYDIAPKELEKKEQNEEGKDKK